MAQHPRLRPSPDYVPAHGLRAGKSVLVPAAAGGPKGLALIPLDRWVFGEWLRDSPRRRELIGAWQVCHVRTKINTFAKSGVETKRAIE